MAMLVLPVFATALILYVNQQLRFGLFYEKVLINPLLTFFGKISFSLYLWHWPILVYGQYFGLEFSWISAIGLFIATIGVSVLTERFVERPFLRVGYVSDFYLPVIVKSRRAMLSILLLLSGGLFVATDQPLISNLLSDVNAQRQQAFWTPPLKVQDEIKTPPSPQQQVAPTDTPTPKKPIYLGIFGDSTNQCCSATGAFWPRIIARNFNWQFADYSKPATSFINSGVGSNNCEQSEDCPSVKGQLSQASKKSFDVISISSGVGDCSLARSNPEGLQKSITKIFQEFKGTYPAALIFTTGLTYPDISSRSDCNSRMNSIIMSASEASGVTFLDVSKVLTNPTVQLTRDTSHLSDSGHAIVAKSVINQLKKVSKFSKFFES
jgi:hypothetical protein